MAKHRSLVSLVFLVAVLATPLSANAYVFLSDMGCAPSRGAAWRVDRGPSRWLLQQNGYPPMALAKVEEILGRSMDSWTSPCCSAFQHAYDGTTSSTGSSMDRKNVVEFATTSWPPEFGGVRSTIAVTLPLITSACDIIEADMVFNAVGFTFRDGSPTDLQSIATHEFGHWLGLDHTDAAGGTMLPWYSGGTAERTLTADDEAGVCGLYPVSCEGCRADADCIAGERCDTGTGICSPQACSSTSACREGSVCWNGSCIAGCRSDAECDGNRICQAGTCIRDPSICAICTPCSRSTDCGGSAYFCIDGGSGGICTKECRTAADCDGDSVCWDVGGGNGLCLAPNAESTSLCPANYQCEGSGPIGCADLWSTCTFAAECGGNLCISTGKGAGHCSCFCIEDRDCGPDAVCEPDGTGGFACVPAPHVDRCSLVECVGRLTCVDGECVDLCKGVACGEGESCEAGLCVSPCGVCAEGTACDLATTTCVAVDPCESLLCGEGTECVVGAEGPACVPIDGCRPDGCLPGERCEAGVCVLDGSGHCGGRTCGNDELCQDGVCVAADRCAGVVCPTGQTCSDGTCTRKPTGGRTKGGGGGCAAGGAGAGALAFASLALLVRRRR